MQFIERNSKMINELENENYVIQIRAKLNQQKVKLWEPPYYNPTTDEYDNAELERLAISFHEQLKISFKDCLSSIQTLQMNALDKLRCKDEFIKTGVATIRCRAPTQAAENRHFVVKIKTSCRGQELVHIVAEKLGVDISRIKLVCAGKVLVNHRPLFEQNVTNGVAVMVLIMLHSVETIQHESNTFDRVHKIRADAELIINDNERSDFFSLEDQDGNALHLPSLERKALLMALTLYEKGKVALRKENYEEALLLFLEADSDFHTCNSQLLTVVDNYALLNMDIVWCYLCLKNISQLPDAEQRLRLCEEKFRESYGVNMHRVTALKGTQHCGEKALLLRLHLLKAVLYFHQNRREDAITMFEVVESELQSLKVDDACLTTLLDCGFEISESRIALRASANNVDAAIEFINNRRQIVEANEKKSKREKNLYKKIGYQNADENRIDVDQVDQLVEMGYSETLAAIALKRTRNNMFNALNELQYKHDDLKRELMSSIKPCKELINKLVDLGYHEEAAQAALKQTYNNFEEAVEFLITARQNNEYDSLLTTAINELVSSSTNILETTTSTSIEDRGSNVPNNELAGPSHKRAKNDTNSAKKQMMDILYKSFSKDMDTTNDTYLDLPLIEEAKVLAEYKKLLNMQ
ncbi:NEDD8 ultimate buster 1-like [Topomyia yanbarensis]|uniref:NEDD8 ultimate buster 1-like n=1 Tax=Topomyia yanbarensis TaxID=2498891 RepID=UPI00273BA080|nr:NEDD8 ultimate buster 1-like [Topomyia yanbarensis]